MTTDLSLPPGSDLQADLQEAWGICRVTPHLHMEFSHEPREPSQKMNLLKCVLTV